MLRAILATLMFWLLLGCSWRVEPWRSAPVVDPVEREVARTDMLAAETRRAQLVGEIARLTWVLRHTANMENRIALELAISDRRAELARLDGVSRP